MRERRLAGDSTGRGWARVLTRPDEYHDEAPALRKA